jgi:peptide-methionine (R)-S-oxide reductase
MKGMPMAERPKITRTDQEWRSILSPEQYNVLRNHGTECAFTGPFLDEKRKGTFLCAGCGAPLFNTDAKFESGTGWPSFFTPVDDQAIVCHEDVSYGMRRVEARCATCDGHLGHIFPDGPRPTGLRYCINGAAFSFKPDEDS